jgi:CheY-like chemotaxis protein
MAWFANRHNVQSSNIEQLNSLANALERLVDGLPLPAEVATWPQPLNTKVPSLANRLCTIRHRLEQLANDELANYVPLEESSGISGITHQVNKIQKKIESYNELREALAKWLDQVLKGDYTQKISNEQATKEPLMLRLNKVVAELEQLKKAQQLHHHYSKANTDLNAALRGEQSLTHLGQNLLTQICQFTGALCGAFFLLGENGRFKLTASRAMTQRHEANKTFALGEGLLGQAAADQQLTVLREFPEDYLPLDSALAKGQPRYVLLWPICWLGEVIAAVELASLSEFTPEQLTWLRENEENVAISLNSLQAKSKVDELLLDANLKNEELDAQSESMKQINAELEEKNEQAMRLQAELEEKNELLSRQQAELEEANNDLERQKSALKERQIEVENASKYKSEFLANMSHELRTPLNSLLLLSGMLLDNDEGNLTEEQLESMAMIKKGGDDLLALINDILDLSKIEAGKLTVIREPVVPQTLAQQLHSQLIPLAQEKNLIFEYESLPGAPELIYTDGQRVAQIVKNLLSNAIKFTDNGKITLRLSALKQPVSLMDGSELDHGIAIAIEDTGKGIAHDKLAEVFQAFKQEDGSITRRFGGTGLGLTISRQLANKLAGDIKVTSTEGKGSIFTLYLPIDGLKNQDNDVVDELPVQHHEEIIAVTPVVAELPKNNPLADDREQCAEGDRCVLVIEDDEVFAKQMIKSIRRQGYKALAATKGQDGLALAHYFKPLGIVLDLGLPDISGEEVIQQLKARSATKNIPIHVASARDNDAKFSALGIIQQLQKPISSSQLEQLIKVIINNDTSKKANLLLVEDDKDTRAVMQKLLQKYPLVLNEASSGTQALTMLKEQQFDGLLLDLGLPDIAGIDVLKTIEQEGLSLPTIILTGKDLSEIEYQALRQFTDQVILKGEQGSSRFLDEIVLFMRNLSHHDNTQTETQVRQSTVDFKDRKILVVDDDVRNVFALNKILRAKGLSVIIANDGKLALDKLNENPDIELVLMDIMMPVMNGYEAIQHIRADNNLKHLPIIALTAKAMAEDRVKCIEAGADEYIAKPVDVDKLFSLIQLFLVDK